MPTTTGSGAPSPAISSGPALGLASDYDGLARPVGAGPDTGAFEYRSAAATSARRVKTRRAATTAAVTADPPGRAVPPAGPRRRAAGDRIERRGRL